MSASNEISAAEAAALMGSGKLSAMRLAEDCLARIRERENDVGAWAFIDPERVLAQARACDSQPRRSPLHGIPVGVKDIIDTADMPTAYGSPIYAGYRPRTDAACVAMLRSAGAVIMGKTVTAEFAMRAPGKTRNPHDLAHTPGGSSSGSGAAVADFMVPLALGTQTGGSVIRPAAFCGTVGFKPSYNVVNRAGVKPAAESLDTVGMMARAVEDVKLALQVLTGGIGSDTAAASTTRPRIGFCRTPQWKHADDATHGALENAASVLARAGAKTDEVVLPGAFDSALDAQEALNEYESSRALTHERRHFAEKMSAALAKKLEKADRVTLEQYLAAQRVLTDCRRLLQNLFADYDLLLVPSAPGEAPRGLSSTGNAIFSRMWTAMHVPAITLPVFKGPSGLPVGVQLIGAYGSDFRTLEHAEWARRALS